eukprot:319540_1
MGNKPDKHTSPDDAKPLDFLSNALSTRHETAGGHIARRRFYNAHHTWNQMRDGSGNDLMFEFIRNCHCNKSKEKKQSIFYLLMKISTSCRDIPYILCLF